MWKYNFIWQILADIEHNKMTLGEIAEMLFMVPNQTWVH